MDKHTAPIFVVVMVSILTLVVTSGIYFSRVISKSNTGGNGSNTACIQDDIKYCPDGTTVSRTGPNCEFAVCVSDSASVEPPFPSCDDMAVPKREMERAVAEALSTGKYNNAWSDAEQWAGLVTYVEQEAGCTLEK